MQTLKRVETKPARTPACVYSCAMLGVLITAVVALALAGAGRRIFDRLLGGLDPAAQWGLGGLFGLAILGWLTLPVGLLPGGLNGGIAIPVLITLGGIASVVKSIQGRQLAFSRPSGVNLAIGTAVLLAFLFGLVGILAPMDGFEWDSLAYHLAVPKIWLEAGQITWIPTIHHSNFPFLVDNLYIWGMKWGGAEGAKAFNLAYCLFGAMALFGLARERYGEKAAWWVLLAFAGMPVAMWEMGTAYIDVAHGIWAGLGVLFAAEYLENSQRRERLWLAAWCLGFAAASKYTGLQVALAAGAVLLGAFLLQKRPSEGLKGAAVVGLAAVVLCSPWLAKNAVWLGNPVYPFFYSAFHGKNWTAWHSEIYENEQHSFGVGNAVGARDWSQFPHAVLGMAYQPGRYTNPAPHMGFGFPTQALGAAVFCGSLLWLVSGRSKRFEVGVLAAVGLCFLMWFYLSQQSRYSLNMGIPLAFLLGAGVARLRAGPVLAAVAGLQMVYSLFLIKTNVVDRKLPVVLGRESAEEYQSRSVPFYRVAQAINEQPAIQRVILYDEVFGYFLKKPYIWGNPGHSTIIDYPGIQDGTGFASALKAIGIDSVYVSFAQEPTGIMARAFGSGQGGPVGDEEFLSAKQDPQTKWKFLIQDAVSMGVLQPVLLAPAGVLFQVAGG